MHMVHSRIVWLRRAMALATTITLFAPVMAARAQAVGSMGLAISPPNTELTVAAGEIVSRTVTVENLGTTKAGVRMMVNNFAASGEEGSAVYEPASVGAPASWFTMVPESFSLDGGESMEVSYTISIPNSASAGGQYATIFAVSSGAVSVSGTGSSVGTAVGANVLLSVAGNVEESASIAEFSVGKARLDAGESAEFTLRVSNEGSTHIRPIGVVEIYRKGVKVDEVAINEDGANVLPNSTRRFVLSSDKTTEPGSYSAVVTLRYGSGQIITSPEIIFSVIGEATMWMIVSGALLTLALILGIALASGRRKPVIR
jgi:uncharacterized membrane protein